MGVMAIPELQDFPPWHPGPVVRRVLFPDVCAVAACDYRPTSLLGNYGAVGAFAMLTSSWH